MADDTLVPGVYSPEQASTDAGLNVDERRELESLREWRRIVTGAPESAQAEVRARMIASETLQPIVQTWRAKVRELEEVVCGMEAGHRRVPTRLCDTYERALAAFPYEDRDTLPDDWRTA